MLVTPSPANRRAFAQWAVAHRVRTSSSNTFDVPDDLFVEIPGDVLVDAKINGQPYVPSTLDLDERIDDLLGVADPFVVDDVDLDTSPLYRDDDPSDSITNDVTLDDDQVVDEPTAPTLDDDGLVVPF